MRRAHEACPYSRATRGNIAVSLTVGGTRVESQAA
jgi:organic hydroperoxide reductase OsmC/OhrA